MEVVVVNRRRIGQVAPGRVQYRHVALVRVDPVAMKAEQGPTHRNTIALSDASLMMTPVGHSS